MSELLALPGFIVALLGGLAALIAIFVTLYVHRREHPRREFSWEARFSPLVAHRVHGLPKLSVVYDGRPVPDPHLVTIEIASTGRADIPSSSFDGQKPILFQLGVPILDEIEQTASTDIVSARLDFVPGGSTIELGPSLLPKRFSIRASYLCEGSPTCQPKIELAEINIRKGSRQASAELNRTLLCLALIMIGILGIVALFVLTKH
ncbi:hypothetical protein DM794_06085 [Paenarthrobacter ureafaciens]|uniref:hypothetical protein n=1 Tax=Paenarthrobacter ureafaciens TaxID=37931 RepID=UPI0015C093BE|nr:hypothetical protein [Paenarthrobacter ureafaciens]NWL26632.1 hypothetical protein [Paenarthrobacter ureafaciens]